MNPARDTSGDETFIHDLGAVGVTITVHEATGRGPLYFGHYTFTHTAGKGLLSVLSGLTFYFNDTSVEAAKQTAIGLAYRNAMRLTGLTLAQVKFEEPANLWDMANKTERPVTARHYDVPHAFATWLCERYPDEYLITPIITLNTQKYWKNPIKLTGPDAEEGFWQDNLFSIMWSCRADQIEFAILTIKETK